jgi:hypothetical protein
MPSAKRPSVYFVEYASTALISKYGEDDYDPSDVTRWIDCASLEDARAVLKSQIASGVAKYGVACKRVGIRPSAEAPGTWDYDIEVIHEE